MRREPKTIVLIHGLWMTPRSMDLFRGFYEDRGYRILAPAWPRLYGGVEDIRLDPSELAGLGVLKVADHFERILNSLDEMPFLIVHCFGGLIVQMLMDRGFGAAGVAINAPAPKGILRLPLSVLKAAGPVLWNPSNYKRIVTLTFEKFRYAFASTMTEADARAIYNSDVIPGPGRQS
jgi:pimeloyl-ACP methyl ester carboxylesterase